jgi:hypothetical protein
MLTTKQKQLVIDYMLHISKGFFEDCEEFWEGMTNEEVDDKYLEYRNAVEDFVDELREKLLNDPKLVVS